MVFLSSLVKYVSTSLYCGSPARFLFTPFEDAFHGGLFPSLRFCLCVLLDRPPSARSAVPIFFCIERLASPPFKRLIPFAALCDPSLCTPQRTLPSNRFPSHTSDPSIPSRFCSFLLQETRHEYPCYTFRRSFSFCFNLPLPAFL